MENKPFTSMIYALPQKKCDFPELRQGSWAELVRVPNSAGPFFLADKQVRFCSDHEVSTVEHRQNIHIYTVCLHVHIEIYNVYIYISNIYMYIYTVNSMQIHTCIASYKIAMCIYHRQPVYVPQPGPPQRGRCKSSRTTLPTPLHLLEKNSWKDWQWEAIGG